MASFLKRDRIILWCVIRSVYFKVKEAVRSPEEVGTWGSIGKGKLLFNSGGGEGAVHRRQVYRFGKWWVSLLRNSYSGLLPGTKVLVFVYGFIHICYNERGSSLSYE